MPNNRLTTLKQFLIVVLKVRLIKRAINNYYNTVIVLFYSTVAVIHHREDCCSGATRPGVPSTRSRVWSSSR